MGILNCRVSSGDTMKSSSIVAKTPSMSSKYSLYLWCMRSSIMAPSYRSVDSFGISTSVVILRSIKGSLFCSVCVGRTREREASLSNIFGDRRVKKVREGEKGLLSVLSLRRFGTIYGIVTDNTTPFFFFFQYLMSSFLADQIFEILRAAPTSRVGKFSTRKFEFEFIFFIIFLKLINFDIIID